MSTALLQRRAELLELQATHQRLLRETAKKVGARGVQKRQPKRPRLLDAPAGATNDGGDDDDDDDDDEEADALLAADEASRGWGGGDDDEGGVRVVHADLYRLGPPYAEALREAAAASPAASDAAAAAAAAAAARRSAARAIGLDRLSGELGPDAMRRGVTLVEWGGALGWREGGHGGRSANAAADAATADADDATTPRAPPRRLRVALSATPPPGGEGAPAVPGEREGGAPRDGGADDGAGRWVVLTPVDPPPAACDARAAAAPTWSERLASLGLWSG